MTTLLCMVRLPMDFWSSQVYDGVGFLNEAVATAATERPAAPERRVCLKREENSLAVVVGYDARPQNSRIQ